MHQADGEQATPLEMARRESELARELFAADEAERRALYQTVYDEKWDLNLRGAAATAEGQARGASSALLPFLHRLSDGVSDVLEVGCGTGYLSLEVASWGPRVTGTDVSIVAIAEARRHAEKAGQTPTFVSGSALDLPVRAESMDLVFSVEVLEHLHEADVLAHLREVWRVLRPGGRYWLLTPNRLYSRHATQRWNLGVEHHREDLLDIHLKEWTHAEVAQVMAEAGFAHLRSPWRHRRFVRLPMLPVLAKQQADAMVGWIPVPLRQWYGAIAGIVGLSVVGTKAKAR